MNIVRDLRKAKGIQQKELAIEIGVSIPAVSNWENGKSDPSGENLKKLAKFFGVSEMELLGSSVPQTQKSGGVSETEQIVQYVLDKLNNSAGASPKTIEARIISEGIDRMPQGDREKALSIMKTVYAEYFNGTEEKNA